MSHIRAVITASPAVLVRSYKLARSADTVTAALISDGTAFVGAEGAEGTAKPSHAAAQLHHCHPSCCLDHC